MKKSILAAIALLISLPFALFAQSDTDLYKLLKKEYNTQRKALKKDGWKLYGSSRTLDLALLDHYKKLAAMGDNAVEIIGNADKCDSKDIGHQLAVNNATAKYAQKCSSTLRGSIHSDLASDGNVSNEVDQFYAAYEKQVQITIRGELEESFCIFREIEAGMYEIQSFFILNKMKAAMAEMAARQKMVELSNTASYFIKEYEEKED